MIFETIFLSLISRGGGGGNNGTPQPISELHRQELYDEIIQNLGLPEEQDAPYNQELKKFIDSIVDNDFKVIGYTDGGKTIIIESNNPNNNDRIYVDDNFLVNINSYDSGLNGYDMTSIITTYIQMPDYLKNGMNKGTGKDGIWFIQDGKTSGRYSHQTNQVIIPPSTLQNPSGDTFALDTVLFHELTHRADFEHGLRRRDYSLINLNQPGGKPKTLSSGLFHDIGLKEQASAYSRSYKYTKTGLLTKKEQKILSYDTENLSETMVVMWIKHNHGGNALVEDPRGINGSNRITVDKWIKLNPDLNRIGEKLYNAKDYTEFKSILTE